MSLISAEREIIVDGRAVPIRGTYDPQFQAVVDAFIENFDVERDLELGASASVVVEGRTVVDLWGGWTEEDRRREWDSDTIVCMMSVAKGITGLAFNMLLDRGIVDADAAVAKYWPEFAANGKEDLPVRYLLDHRAGLPVLYPETLYPGAMYDREAMLGALASQKPMWAPGTTAAYHVHTQGYLLGEVSLRASGKLIGELVRDEISVPLGADYWIGLPEREFGRVATLLPNPESRLIASKDSEAPEDRLRNLAFLQNPPGPWVEMLNSPEFRSMEMPSGSGHGNARAVARIYGAVANGIVDGVQLLSDEQVERMTTVQHQQIEKLQERHYRQGLGILLNSPDAVYMGPHEQAFGHHGIGGSIGFADRQEKLGFSYAMNRMHSTGTNGPRARRLIDAAFDSL